MEIAVETQGISADFTCADGSYDPVDRGTVRESDLLDMLLRLERMHPAPAPDGADLCPPLVQASASRGTFNFTNLGRGVHCLDTEDDLGAREAVDVVVGRHVGAPGGRGRRKYPAGHTPVRHPHLDPSSDSGRDRSQVDRSAPALSTLARAEDTAWKGGFLFGGLLLAVALLVIALLVGSREWNTTAAITGAVSLAAGVPVLRWAASRRSEPLAAGVCWRTNAVWIERGARFHTVPDANCVTGFDVVQGVDVTPGDAGADSVEEKYWSVVARYAGGKPAAVARFDRRADAEGVAARLGAALQATPLAAAAPGPAPTAPAPTAGACARCRTPRTPGVRFCSRCGAPADAGCGACGATVVPGAAFCSACGAPAGP